MINKYSFNAATTLLALCKQNGFSLVPSSESPVGLLNRAIDNGPIFSPKMSDDDFFEHYPDLSTKSQTADGNGERNVIQDTAAGVEAINLDDHEATLHDLKRIAIQRCDGMQDFARNVIQPFINEVIKNNDTTPQAVVQEEWSIVPVALDDLLGDDVVLALLDTVKDPVRTGYLTDANERIQVPDELPIPVTGSKSYDELVVKLLEETNCSIHQAVKCMLEGCQVNPQNQYAYEHLKGRIGDAVLSAYYIENPWPDSGVSAQAWETAMKQIHYTSLAWIALYIRGVTERVNNGLMVITYNNTEKKVVVCQESFEKYIDAGGQPEALLGAVYSLSDGASGVSASRESLLKDQDRYVGVWDRRSTITRANHDTNWLTTNRRALKQAFRLAIGTLDPGYLRVNSDGNPIAVGEILDGVNDMIDAMIAPGVSDLTEVVIKIAANEVFGEPELRSLLLTIHHGILNNVDPRQSASSWMINYVLTWICDGMSVVKAP